MQDRTRRVIAYIAGRLITGKYTDNVVDVATGISCALHGDVGPTKIDLEDLEENTSVKGSGTLREMIIIDNFNRAQVKLTIKDRLYYGWDLTTDVAFYGRVDGDEVRMKHPGDKRPRQFLI